VLKGLVARFYIHEIVSPANQYGCSILIAIHKEVNVTRLKLNVALMATALVVTTSSYAAEVTFEETKILLQNEDVKSFQLKDINGDHRLDIIWQTNNGELKYKLQNNQAMMNFKNLPGTKWRLNYDNNDDSKTIEFFAKGGVIENQSNYFWNIVNWEINENIPSNDRKFIVGEVNFTGLIPVDTPNSSIISISNSDFILTSYANRGTANDLASDCAAAGFPAANHKKLRFNLEYTGTYTLDPYASVSVNVTITDVGAGTAARTLVVTINPDALMTVNQLQKFDFRFSPNPAKENINLSAIKNISKVEIYNLLGQKSMRVSVNAVRKTLNISELPTGIYIMQVTIDDVMGSYKIIKR